MAKNAGNGDIDESLEVLDSKLDALDERLKKFEAFEEHVDRVVTQRLYDTRLVAYLTLVLVTVIFFFVIGYVLKQVGF